MRRKGMLFLTMFLFCLGLFKFNVDAAVMINNGTYNILSALNNNTPLYNFLNKNIVQGLSDV